MKTTLLYGFACLMVGCASGQNINESYNTTVKNTNATPSEEKTEIVSDSLSIQDDEMQAPVSPSKKLETKQKMVVAPSSVAKDQDPFGNSSFASPKQAEAEFQSSQSSFSKKSYSRSYTPEEQRILNNNVNYLNAVAPGTFETNLYNYKANHYNTSYSPYLLEAAQQEPNNKELQEQLAADYLVNDERVLADSVIQQMITVGNISTGQQYYAFNLAASTFQNSTLIVHSLSDLLPVCAQQGTFNNSFTIVSMELLQSETYRQQLVANGYQLPKSAIIDTTFFKQFCTMNGDKNIQVSMTLPKDYLNTLLPSIYPVGTTFSLYDGAENLSKNVQLWEREWKKEAINATYNDQSDALMSNYLPTLIVLKNYYDKNGNKEESEHIKELITSIADKTRNSSKVKKFVK